MIVMTELVLSATLNGSNSKRIKDESEAKDRGMMIPISHTSPVIHGWQDMSSGTRYNPNSSQSPG